MPIASSKLAHAVRVALAFGVATMAPTAVALAQDGGQNATTQKPQQMQTITVTGSRIRSVDVETQQPVFTMTQQDIQKTGLATVGDLVQHMTVTGTPTYTRSSVLASNFEQGGSYVDMRNLGAQRVLVLVNGKRWVSGTDGYVDVSSIPTALIQRVDVLKDGASSIYGSDAISGVINFILKDRFNGAQAHVYYGQNQKGDGQTTQYDFTAGTHTDKTSIVFSASYNKQDAVWAKTRPETATPFGKHHVGEGYGLGPWGEFVDPATGNTMVLNHSGSDSLGLGQGADSRNLSNYHAYKGAATDKFNYSHQMMYLQPSTLKSIFTHVSHDITDNVTFKATAMYADRNSTAQTAGYPAHTFAQPNYPVYVDANSYYNPMPGQKLDFSRRTIELPRITQNEYQSLHVDSSIEGWFDIGEHEWNWDVGVNYNRGTGVLNTSGNLNLVALKNALGPSFLNAAGQVQCGTKANPLPLGTSLSAGQCMPLDILGGPSASSAQALQYINALGKETYASTTKDYTANITGGLFNLPAGEFSFAAGVESRTESGYDRPDQMDQSGMTTNLAANTTSGHYHVNEAYVEFSAPLLSDLPGAQKLSVDVASRYSHYSNFGSTTNNKYSFEWKPIEDLLVRGNYAEGFRAPTIGDLFGGGSQSFDTYIDPCDSVYGAAASKPAVAAKCAAQGVPANFRQLDQSGVAITSPGGTQSPVPFSAGAGNASLQPETSITRTLGLVYSPHQVQGLDMTLDWYRIRIDNIITSIDANYVLNQCYINNSAQYCGAFSRDPSSSQIVTLSRGNANLGYLDTAGYDLAVNYRLPQFGYGHFAVHMQSSYVTKFDEQGGAGSTVTKSVGQWSDAQAAPIYRLRTNLGVDWQKGNWGATWTMRYFSSIRDLCYSSTECNEPKYTSPSWSNGIGANRKGAIAFNDVQVRWTAPWKATVSVGVNNIFNRKAGVDYSAFSDGASSASSYNPNMDIDRYFYLNYTQKF